MIARLNISLAVAIFVLMVVGSPRTLAEHGRDGVDPDSIAYQRALRSFTAGEYERARDLFRDVFRTNPAYVGAQGAAAYWLGRSFEACEQPDSSRWTYRTGFRAAESTQETPLRLFDAYLRTLVTPLKRLSLRIDGASTRAESVYFDILATLGSRTSSWEKSLLHQHVLQLRPLMSESDIQSLLVSGEADNPEDWTYRKEAGERLLSWWRRKDPNPSSRLNERAVEHLYRVARAQQAYADARSIRGWDERGDIYIRYGNPSRKRTINFDDARFLLDVIRPPMPITRADFPRNEVWVYSHLGADGQFVFVEENGSYEVSSPINMLPEVLRGPFSSAQRSQNLAYSSISALRYIYDQLSLHYQYSGVVSDDIESWFNFQNVANALTNTRMDKMVIGDGAGRRVMFRGPGPSQSFPSFAATRALADAAAEERSFVRRRAHTVPDTYAVSRDAYTPLDVEAHFARFLTEQGETRTEVYWTHDLGVSGVPLQKQQIIATVIEHDIDYEVRRREMDRHSPSSVRASDQTSRVPRESVRSLEITTPRSTKGGRYHVSMQWDRIIDGSPLASRNGEDGDDESLGRSVVWKDSLKALSSDPGVLEMSDLKPVVLPREEYLQDGLSKATPYPSRTIDPSQDLAFYFEVYHLNFGKGDQTHWRTEYEVEYRVRRGFAGRVFGPNYKVERTSTDAESVGSTSRTEEIIYIDLDPDKLMDETPVVITVRVTDEVSGRSVERSLNFELADAN